MRKLICDDCYDMLFQPAVVATIKYGPCYFCGKDSDDYMASLYNTPSEVIAPLMSELELYRSGRQGACYACEPVGIKNLELSNALTEVMLTAIKNGEDCSYLVAKKALDTSISQELR